MIKFIVLWFLEFMWLLSNQLMKPRMLSYKKGLQREKDCKKFDFELYNERKKENFTIVSDYGYSLCCELVEAEDNKDLKIVILCHGFGYARYGSIKYMELFLKLGFHVLIYDHRNHGNSGKALTSMGFYEKYDLINVVDWCYKRYGDDCKIITHGESMGAATVLLHLGVDDRVKGVIADCPYSDLDQLLRHQLKQFYHLPCFLIPIESAIMYLRAGCWFRQVSPIKVVSQTDTPILFIHGKIDNMVPASMSKEMYEAKPKNKAIYLVAKAKHADCYCKKPGEYEYRIIDFLNKVFRNLQQG
ncbi:MAG: hypothetical protein K0R00_629 [Herbinix sp.]|nr:hypothetical protein [Herbinix sp.]